MAIEAKVIPEKQMVDIMENADLQDGDEIKVTKNGKLFKNLFFKVIIKPGKISQLTKSKTPIRAQGNKRYFSLFFTNAIKVIATTNPNQALRVIVSTNT